MVEIHKAPKKDNEDPYKMNHLKRYSFDPKLGFVSLRDKIEIPEKDMMEYLWNESIQVE